MRLIDTDALQQYLFDKSFYSTIMVKAIENMPTVNPYEWISVEDRLPESKINCIVCYKHAYCDDDGYYAINIVFYDGQNFNIFDKAYKVTHWMPLPEPPREEN